MSALHHLRNSTTKREAVDASPTLSRIAGSFVLHPLDLARRARSCAAAAEEGRNCALTGRMR
jgi:hypothetical protein